VEVDAVASDEVAVHSVVIILDRIVVVSTTVEDEVIEDTDKKIMT